MNSMNGQHNDGFHMNYGIYTHDTYIFEMDIYRKESIWQTHRKLCEQIWLGWNATGEIAKSIKTMNKRRVFFR